MSATATEQPRTEQEDATPAGDRTGPSPRPSLGAPVVSLRDVVLPVVVAAVLVALYFYIQGQQLDNIEVNLLAFDAILELTIDHIVLSFTIAVLVVLIAVPLGVLVTRPSTRRVAPVVLALANLGQSAPSLGLIALVGIYYTGFWAVVFVLTAYAILAVLRNTIAGLQAVNTGVLDAAKGMGMSPSAVLMRVELPLAVPIIAAGARTALILAVATVPLGAFIGAGGLGQNLIGAIKTDRAVATLSMAVIIACLALTLDWLAAILQRWATPRGIR